MFVCLFVQLRTEALRLIVRSWLDVPTFATRRLHACHHARAPSGGRWNCGREISGNFARITTSTPFRDLLRAVKLRHGTDGFTSPPKEGVLSIFFRPKNPTASAGFEPANLGTKGQHATSRPPKPLGGYLHCFFIFPHAARRPTQNNWCVPVTQKVLTSLVYISISLYYIILTL